MNNMHYIVGTEGFREKMRDPRFVQIDQHKGKIGDTIYCVTTPPQVLPMEYLIECCFHAPRWPAETEFREATGVTAGQPKE